MTIFPNSGSKNSIMISIHYHVLIFSNRNLKNLQLLAENVESVAYPSSEERDSPDAGLPEANYQAYQSAVSYMYKINYIFNVFFLSR